ncbi:MAG TPA: D-aminoacyl-tRNA deacylase, partial [Nitrososphaera sp.]|nr:D-aminoacyl-tRNA deacylase [Nitrososphaera sp.]
MTAAAGNNYLLVASTSDKAGDTLATSLLSLGKFTKDSQNKVGTTYASKEYPNLKLCTSPDSVLSMDYLDDFFPAAGAFIFLSKHKSDSSIPTLTCHSTGNFSGNPYGGKPRELAIAAP